ncbi:MAG: hypothetical protein LQ342_002099 [Letrouitia transgressa]|nr:MAG: hypothetical protein LQ342_002099 [Letrouitia transgressa]
MDKFFLSLTSKQNPSQPSSTQPVTREGDNDEQAPTGKKLPKGVVLGPDGKPSYAAFSAFTKSKSPSSSTTTTSTSTATSSSSASSTEPPENCPPDVDQLGRSTWTLLHTISASYPPRASTTQQSEMRQFLSLFSKIYPCWVCAEDFQDWMKQRGNEPRVEGREGLGRWMCEAHNAVNRKLGKREFDCGGWEERWRTGCGGGEED